MAGNTGSPLCAELNRIANYGVYPDRDDFLEEQGAANVWAGTSGQGLLGALNYIVDPNRTDNNYKGLTAVCNELAGTTGLSDVDALRTIGHPAEVLLKGTTARSASYYVDAATPTNWGSLGYVYLPGVAGNYLSTPDATALDVTGDIDLRARVALDDWTPSAAQIIISKYTTATNNRSYRLQVNTDGTLQITWSSLGTSATAISKASTVATGVTDGSVKWVRATLDVDNGASGNDVKFYLSDDGTTWTQLGTTVTTAGTTSIFNSTSILEIGASENASLLTGKVYRAQVLDGIGGTTVLDVNIATDYKSSNLDTFTATTGQTVTVNGVGTVANYGTAGSLLPTTVGSSTAADSNDPKFLDHTGTNYVYLTGVAGNQMSAPNSAALQISGDIDLRWYGAMDDWTPAAIGSLISRLPIAGNYSYNFYLNTNGTLGFAWSSDGTATTQINSTTAPTVSDGSPLWVRVTFDVDNGAGGKDAKFFTSTDGTTWTQLGTTVTSAGTTTIFAGTGTIEIGSRISGSGQHLASKVFRAQIYSDITETTKVLDVDTSVITTGAATSFTAVTGQTVTINRSTSGRKSVAVTQPTWLFGTDDYMEVNNRYMAHSTAAENYVYLSGASGNYMSVADNPPLDIAGDLDIQVKVALDDWTPGAGSCLLSKSNATGNQRSYFLGITTGGILQLTTSPDGSTLLTRSCTVATSITDGTVKWVRATIDVDNGSGGNDVKFFLSDDGSTWTQLGTTVTTAGVTSIFNSTTPVEVGSRTNGTIEVSKGKFFRSIVKNGIDGTIVLDADASVITLPSQTTFVDRSSNAYTVTINKSGVGTFVSTGNYLYLPGVNSNTASAPDSVPLDITGDIDVRVKVAADDWTPAAVSNFIAKWQVTGNQRSWRFSLNTNGGLFAEWSADGTNVLSHFLGGLGLVDGSTKWVRWTLDVDNGASGNDSKFFTSDDGITWTQVGTTQTTAGVTSIYNSTAALEIGAVGGQNTLRDNSTTDFLNFGAADSFTVMGIIRRPSFSGDYGPVISKSNGNDYPGYQIRKPAGTGATLSSYLGGSSSSVASGSVTSTAGQLETVMMRVDRTAQTVVTNLNGTDSTSTSISSIGSVLNIIDTLKIGRTSVNAFYIDMEFYGAAVFRNTLTTKNIADITNYFNGRD
jgi:hypothetical protein